MTTLYMQYGLLLDRILACVNKVIPGLKNDTTREWQRVTEEGKTLCEEIQKLQGRDD